MWSALFGSSNPSTPVVEEVKDSAASNESGASCVSDETQVYLIDGTLRVPCPFPAEHAKNVVALRQWVFDTIARLPGEERVEAYTFKVLPEGYVYWYSFALGGTYGILMKHDAKEGRFTGISPADHLPILQSTPLPPLPPLHNNKDTSNHHNTCSPKKTPAKRSAPKRTRK